MASAGPVPLENIPSVRAAPASLAAPIHSPSLQPTSREAGNDRNDLRGYGLGDRYDAYLNAQRQPQESSWDETNNHSPGRASRLPEPNSRVPQEPSSQCIEHVSDFIRRNLENFYCPNDFCPATSTQQMIQEATVRAQQVTEHFGLSSEYTPRLTILALYDFFMLCGM
jgi:hypothetical protein